MDSEIFSVLEIQVFKGFRGVIIYSSQHYQTVYTTKMNFTIEITTSLKPTQWKASALLKYLSKF